MSREAELRDLHRAFGRPPCPDCDGTGVTTTLGADFDQRAEQWYPRESEIECWRCRGLGLLAEDGS